MDRHPGIRDSGPSTAITLLRHKAWADRLTYETLLSMPEVELHRERETTFGSIARTMHHIHIVDDIFRAHVEGCDHGYTRRSEDDVPTMDRLARDAARLNDWWLDMMLHIAVHATYHRGHVDDMMYQIPAVPPTTDLSVFLTASCGER